MRQKFDGGWLILAPKIAGTQITCYAPTLDPLIPMAYSILYEVRNPSVLGPLSKCYWHVTSVQKQANHPNRRVFFGVLNVV